MSSSIQEQLQEAINNYGVSDIRTLKISEERDKEIVEEQREIYNLWTGKIKRYI